MEQGILGFSVFHFAPLVTVRHTKKSTIFPLRRTKRCQKHSEKAHISCQTECGGSYTLTVNGKKKDVKRTKDTLGNPFKTEKSALKAREAAIIHEHTQREHKPIKNRLRFRRLALPP
jgi:hypothetical protein